MGDEKVVATLKERQDAIQSIMDENLFQQLFTYGIYRLKTKFGVRYDTQRGFRGLMMEDLILELFESFLTEGGRNWYKEKTPDFKVQLFSGFDSHISNTVKKVLEKTASTVTEEHIQDVGDADEGYNKLINVCLEVLEQGGATYEEIQLFEPYYIHGMKRDDVAKQFNMSVEDVTKMKTKLAKKLPLLRDAINNAEL